MLFKFVGFYIYDGIVVLFNKNLVGVYYMFYIVLVVEIFGGLKFS